MSAPAVARAGTRASALARAQTEWVIARLKQAEPGQAWECVIITTSGDTSAAVALGTGVFVKELQQALLEGRIDIAVHSLKDLPTEPTPGLVIAAVPPRADPREALVGTPLNSLAPGARVGTGSPRRAALLRRVRADLQVIPTRGNLPTRIEKARSGEVAAVMLAAAGLQRLGLPADDLLDSRQFLPAPGQGALAIQMRDEETPLRRLVERLEDAPTRAAVTAERAVLRAMGGGCMLAVAAYGRIVQGALVVDAAVTSPDGTRQVAARSQGEPAQAEEIGARMGARLIDLGALALLSAPPVAPQENRAGGPGRLAGRRILVLRPEGQEADLVGALRDAGAEPVVVPAIEILPSPDRQRVRAALQRRHDWLIFTSVNGVAAVASPGDAATLQGRIAAVGPATADALAALGIAVDFIPDAYTTVALAQGLPGPPGSVCLLRAEIAGTDLEDILTERGFRVERLNAYRTQALDPEPIRQALASGVDGVALTSASIAEAFAAAAGTPAGQPAAAVYSIGPATSAACRRLGLAVAAMAASHTMTGLVDTMAAHLGPQPGPAQGPTAGPAQGPPAGTQ